jgi:hypothetical protein
MQKYGVPIGGTIGASTYVPENATEWLTFGSRTREVSQSVNGATEYANARTMERDFFIAMIHPSNYDNASIMYKQLDELFEAVSSYDDNWYATISEFYSYIELRRNCTTISENSNGTYTITTDFSKFAKPPLSESNYNERILRVPLTYVFHTPYGFNVSDWVVLKNNRAMLPRNYASYSHMGFYDDWWEGYYFDALNNMLYINIIGSGKDLISFSRLNELTHPSIWELSATRNGKTIGACIRQYEFDNKSLTVVFDARDAPYTLKIYSIANPQSISVQNETISSWTYDPLSKILTITIANAECVNLVVNWNQYEIPELPKNLLTIFLVLTILTRVTLFLKTSANKNKKEKLFTRHF